MDLLPWRTVLPVRETGRFTPEQLERAVDWVMARRREADVRPMYLREPGVKWGEVPRPEPPAPAPPADPVPYAKPRRARGRKRREAGEQG